MSDLNEEEKKIERQENIKLEMLEKKKSSLKVPKKEGSEERKESLHSQMVKKVRPTDYIIMQSERDVAPWTTAWCYKWDRIDL